MKSLLFSLCLIAFSAGAESRCRGGDGPTPFIEDGIASHAAQLIPTEGLVQSFAVQEDKERLLYSDEHQDLWSMRLDGQHDSKILGSAPFGISQFLPFAEDALLSKDQQWYSRHSSHPVWKRWKQRRGERALFWKGERLFSFRDLEAISARSTRFSYDERDVVTGKITQHACYLPREKNETLRVGEGQVEGGAFVYGTIPTGRATLLRIYRLDLIASQDKTLCEKEAVGFYPEPIAGAITSVRGFEKPTRFVVRTDHPTLNLLWDSPEECIYFDVGATEIIYPNPRLPQFLTWGRGKGMRLYWPTQHRVVSILKDQILYPTKQEQVWLSDDARHLWVSVKMKEAQSGGLLFGIPLERPATYAN